MTEENQIPAAWMREHERVKRQLAEAEKKCIKLYSEMTVLTSKNEVLNKILAHARTMIKEASVAVRDDRYRAVPWSCLSNMSTLIERYDQTNGGTSG